MNLRNWGKLMPPVFSSSSSSMISCKSSSVGCCWPRPFRSSPTSAKLILPLEFLSIICQHKQLKPEGWTVQPLTYTKSLLVFFHIIFCYTFKETLLFKSFPSDFYRLCFWHDNQNNYSLSMCLVLVSMTMCHLSRLGQYKMMIMNPIMWMQR